VILDFRFWILDWGTGSARLLLQSGNPKSRRAKRIMRQENPKSKIPLGGLCQKLH
jgi:hypothetical protein